MPNPFTPLKRILILCVLFFLATVMISTNNGVTKLKTAENWEIVKPIQRPNGTYAVPVGGSQALELHHPFWSPIILINKASVITVSQLGWAYILVFPYWLGFSMVAAIVGNFVLKKPK